MAVLAQASREPAIQESNRRSRTLKSQRPHPGKGEAFEFPGARRNRIYLLQSTPLLLESS